MLIPPSLHYEDIVFCCQLEDLRTVENALVCCGNKLFRLKKTTNTSPHMTVVRHLMPDWSFSEGALVTETSSQAEWANKMTSPQRLREYVFAHSMFSMWLCSNNSEHKHSISESLEEEIPHSSNGCMIKAVLRLGYDSDFVPLAHGALWLMFATWVERDVGHLWRRCH